MTGTHVALLRGINVGGKHKLPMARARELLTEAGLGPVASYIQSGNLVLTSDLPETELAGRIRGLLEQDAGFPVPTVVMERGELLEALERNPYSPAAPKLEHLVFLPNAVDEVRERRLAGLRSELGGVDDLTVRGRVVYLNHPDGLLQSPLAAKATALLKDGTARNLATVLKLVELLG